MALAQVLNVDTDSPADIAGILAGDEIVAINGRFPRDIIEYSIWTDEAEVDLDIRRGGLDLTINIVKQDGQPLGMEIASAIFDRVRTCDNHCEFCFIYQLPKGLRRSLYVKDDDYRLSFLYGNFTTLTRFTESDLERVITERLSPLFVSIHATDPQIRAKMVRNQRGAISLRWLRALLDNDIEVHGQVVVCPGMNDGLILEDTLAGILEQYFDITTVAVVPLGVSKYSKEPNMRPHSQKEAVEVVEMVEQWQEIFLQAVGRRVVYAADEYYLLAKKPFPLAPNYENFLQHENGIGMSRAFHESFFGNTDLAFGPKAGFFSSLEAAPAEGYRSIRNPTSGNIVFKTRRNLPIGIITGQYGAQVLSPLVKELDRSDIRLIIVKNNFFGGNIAVTGLLAGCDIAEVLDKEPLGHRYLLPDVCLSKGVFIDGTTLDDLPKVVEVVPTDGASLAKALESKLSLV